VSHERRVATVANSRRRTMVLLIGLLVIGATLRIADAADKTTYGYAEGMSYLGATAHWSEYLDSSMADSNAADTWRDASYWHSLLAADRPLAFGAIGRGQARHDIHPPLYFWLLNIWMLVIPLTPASGPLLNTLLALGTGLALFRLARLVGVDRRQALVVVATWMFSPAVVWIPWLTRQYSLLGLISVLYVGTVVRAVRDGRPRATVGLALLTAMGLLTHYHFALLVAGCAIYALSGARRRPARTATVYAAMAAGAALFVVLHPEFYRAFTVGTLRPDALMRGELLGRLRLASGNLLAFALPKYVVKGLLSGQFSPLVLMPVLAWAIYVIAVALVTFPCGAHRRSRGDWGRFVLPVATGLWMLATILWLYLIGLSPAHAMAERYLAMAWPFVSFLPLLVLASLGLGQAHRQALCAVLLVCSMCMIADRYMHRDVRPETFLGEATRVVCDNTSSGLWPRVVLHVSEGTPVLVGRQNELLQSQALTSVDLDGAVFVSSLVDQGSVEMRGRILTELATDYAVTQIAEGIWDRDVVYRLDKRGSWPQQGGILDIKVARQLAWIGDGYTRGTPRAVVLVFHGLGYTDIKRGPSADEIAWSEAGGIVVFPYYGPWSWMNRQARTLVDDLVEAVYAGLGLPDGLPLISTGGSMGGLSALLYTRYARRPIAGCLARYPVCDLAYHYDERPDLPRTVEHALGGYRETMERLLAEHSPLAQASHMPRVPYMIVHGDADGMVSKTAHSDKMVEAMRDSGHDVTYLEVPGMGHGRDVPPHVTWQEIDFVRGLYTR